MTFTTTYRAFSRFFAALTIGALVVTLAPTATFAQEPSDEALRTAENTTAADLDIDTDFLDDFFDDQTGTTSPTEPKTTVQNLLPTFDLPFSFDSFDDFLDDFEPSDFIDFDITFCTEEDFSSHFLDAFPLFEDVLNDFPGDLFNFICDRTSPDPDPDPDPQDEVTVHIYKYFEDADDDLSLATEGSFDMTATWQADNIDNGSSTTGQFTLESGNNWHAATAVMDAGADYTTSEMMNDTVLAPEAVCVADAYRLVGYKTGNTLSAAESALLSADAPDFENLTNDKYVIVVNEDCDDVLNPDPDPDPELQMCSIVSDEGTLLATSTPSVDTFVHGAWTTEFDTTDAEWIWSTATVTDPTTEETVTFTKTFVAGTTTDAELRVAADNYYTATLNGNPVGCSGDAGDNHTAADVCTVSLQNGTNTLQFVVTNEAGDADPEVNPAGLIFDLSWEAESCTGNTGPGPEEPLACTLEIISDASNRAGDGAFAVLVSQLSDAWDAMIDGARWIWGEDPVADAVNETSETFTKSFNWGGDVADIDSAMLTIASDNAFAATLNGSTTASSTASDNYSNETSYDVTDLIKTGANDLSIMVTNFAETGGTPESNPAGLLYKLTVVGGNNNCIADGGNNDNDADTYLVYGYVWNDENDNQMFDGEGEDETGIEGQTVNATDGTTTVSAMTDANGYYELTLSEGTWTISHADNDDWNQTTSSSGSEETLPVNEDGDYVVTFPKVAEEETALLFPFNLFLPTAHAAVVDTLGPLSFGLSEISDGGGGGGGSRGGGGGSSRRSSSDDDDSNGEVLGAQTSVIPYGGANAGGGGTAVTIPTFQQLLARPEKFARFSKN